MEARHVVRCLRSSPSASISTIARRQNYSSGAGSSLVFRGQRTGIRSQGSISSVPSSRRYLSTSESQQSPSESKQQQQPPAESSEAKSENPPAESSQPSASPSAGGLNTSASQGQTGPKSNARKLGDVSDILNQLGMRKPKPQNRALDSLFPETQGSVKSPSIAQLSERVKSSLSRSDPLTPPKVNLRLGPSLGRTVMVDQSRGFDATRAIRSMEMMCGRNKVRTHERDQRFHLRRGQKRKDMRSARWRKLFNESFQKTLLRCHRMRQQGW